MNATDNPVKPATITLRDLWLLAGLPVLGLLAWVVPPSGWPVITGCIARLVAPVLKFFRPQVPVNIEYARRNRDIPHSASRIYRGWLARRLEQELQIYREYRPGGFLPKIELQGRIHLEQAIAAQHGVILWIAPLMFSGLLVKKALHANGHPATHLSREYHGPSETRFGRRWINPVTIKAEQRYLGERLVMASAREAPALRRLVRALKKRQLVSISCSYYGRKIVPAPLLGGTLPIAAGAASLALSTGAVLLPVFTVRTSPCCFEIKIAPPVTKPVVDPQQTAISQMVSQYAQQIEQFVIDQPESFVDWSRLSENYAGG